MSIDFQPGIGVKRASAQLTKHDTPDAKILLVGA
jgi:hypothetical protein